MMNEEKYIEEKVGKRNPFLVPEGYFDTFASQLMSQIAEKPERQPRAKSVWLRKPLYYAAACVCALFLSGSAWLFFSKSDVPAQQPVQMASQQESGDVDFDEAADYMMLDNQDIYNYLAEN